MGHFFFLFSFFFLFCLEYPRWPRNIGAAVAAEFDGGFSWSGVKCRVYFVMNVGDFMNFVQKLGVERIQNSSLSVVG